MFHPANKLTSAGALILCLLSACPTGFAAAPALRASALETTPVIDGDVLGDAAWRSLPAATGFTQTRPDEGRPASQRTKVWVGFTEDALYIGAVCYDSEPSGIIVADSRRDSDLNETDSFQLLLDTYQDGQNGFIFGTNPAGVEYDGQVTQEGIGRRFGSGGVGGFNLNWDTSWTVASRIGDYGWSTEFLIPFSSLRYDRDAVQTWGINFQRNIRRNYEQAFWAPLPRQHNLLRVSQAGAMTGLEVPSQRNLQFMPYGLAKGHKGGPSLKGTETDTELGVDIKYLLTPSLTLDATYNTDFAQVEADEIQVNLDRFSLFFAEKRPFFLENAGLFTVGDPGQAELFFSRRIGISEDGGQIPIEGGLRLSGKVGGNTHVGLLHMRSDAITGIAPRNDYSVARLKQELPNRSALGVMFVNRDGADGIGGGSNRTYAIDGRLGLGDVASINGWAAKTDSPHLSGSDHAFKLGADYNSKNWANAVSYTEVATNFNPEVGFLARRAYRKASARTLRRIRPKSLWGLHELRPHIAYFGYWGYGDGYHESDFLHIDNHWEWKSGLEIHTGINFTREGVREAFEIHDGVVVPPGGYDHKEAQLVFWTDQAAPLSFSIRSRIGGRFGGDRINFDSSLRWRIGEKFNSELSWIYNDFELPGGEFTVNVARLRLTYSFTPRMSLQALVQYDDRENVLATNLRFAWLQTANAGLYLVYNEFDDRDFAGEPRREITLKYSRIVNLL